MYEILFPFLLLSIVDIPIVKNPENQCMVMVILQESIATTLTLTYKAREVPLCEFQIKHFKSNLFITILS